AGEEERGAAQRAEREEQRERGHVHEPRAHARALARDDPSRAEEWHEQTERALRGESETCTAPEQPRSRAPRTLVEGELRRARAAKAAPAAPASASALPRTSGASGVERVASSSSSALAPNTSAASSAARASRNSVRAARAVAASAHAAHRRNGRRAPRALKP